MRRHSSNGHKLLRVLILDDDEPVAESMCDILKFRDHEVLVVHELEQALRALALETPDVFVADFRIGQIRSDVFIAHARVQWPALRCVLVSGSHPREWDHIVESGLVHAALRKPFDFTRFIDAVEG